MIRRLRFISDVVKAKAWTLEVKAKAVRPEVKAKAVRPEAKAKAVRPEVKAKAVRREAKAKAKAWTFYAKAFKHTAIAEIKIRRLRSTSDILTGIGRPNELNFDCFLLIYSFLINYT